MKNLKDTEIPPDVTMQDVLAFLDIRTHNMKIGGHRDIPNALTIWCGHTRKIWGRKAETKMALGYDVVFNHYSILEGTTKAYTEKPWLKKLLNTLIKKELDEQTPEERAARMVEQLEHTGRVHRVDTFRLSADGFQSIMDQLDPTDQHDRAIAGELKSFWREDVDGSYRTVVPCLFSEKTVAFQQRMRPHYCWGVPNWRKDLQQMWRNDQNLLMWDMVGAHLKIALRLIEQAGLQDLVPNLLFLCNNHKAVEDMWQAVGIKKKQAKTLVRAMLYSTRKQNARCFKTALQTAAFESGVTHNEVHRSEAFKLWAKIVPEVVLFANKLLELFPSFDKRSAGESLTSCLSRLLLNEEFVQYQAVEQCLAAQHNIIPASYEADGGSARSAATLTSCDIEAIIADVKKRTNVELKITQPTLKACKGKLLHGRSYIVRALKSSEDIQDDLTDLVMQELEDEHWSLQNKK